MYLFNKIITGLGVTQSILSVNRKNNNKGFKLVIKNYTCLCYISHSKLFQVNLKQKSFLRHGTNVNKKKYNYNLSLPYFFQTSVVLFSRK